MRKTLLERFEEKTLLIPFSTCHWWDGAPDRNGYGRISVGSVNYSAHRMAYKIYKGEIPENMIVCHTCDNPMCVNPDHLWLGTNRENLQDMVKKGRTGERGRKFNRNKAATIRFLSESFSTKEIAAFYSVKPRAIRNIINRKTWKHI